MAASLKPLAKHEAIPGAGSSLVRRSTFRSRLAKMIGADLAIRPFDRARPRTDGVSIEPRNTAPQFPFEVDFGGDGFTVAPGCVVIAGSATPYILQSDGLDYASPGFIVVNATIRAPQWEIGTGDNVVHHFAGWVIVDVAPYLGFATAPPTMYAVANWAPITTEPVQVCFPIAYIDRDAGVIIQLVEHSIGIGLRLENRGTEVTYCLA